MGYRLHPQRATRSGRNRAGQRRHHRHRRVEGGSHDQAHTPGYVVGIAFSPDGRLVASGGQDGLAVNEVATGARVYGLTRGSNFTLGVTFSPDGRRVAVGFSDGTAQVLDARTGRADGPPIVFSCGWVGGIAYSPDGRTIAMGQGDGTIFLVDARTHALSSPLTGHTDQIIGVAFTPDGKRLASTGFDGTTRLWDLDVEPWGAQRACVIAGRNLTRAEWAQYLPGRAYHRTCAQYPAGA